MNDPTKSRLNKSLLHKIISLSKHSLPRYSEINSEYSTLDRRKDAIMWF